MSMLIHAQSKLVEMMHNSTFVADQERIMIMKRRREREGARSAHAED